MDQIEESRKLAESRDPVPSPAVLAARERHQRLSKEYDALWASRSPGIRKRLAESDQSLLSAQGSASWKLAWRQRSGRKRASPNNLKKWKWSASPRAMMILRLPT